MKREGDWRVNIYTIYILKLKRKERRNFQVLSGISMVPERAAAAAVMVHGARVHSCDYVLN